MAYTSNTAPQAVSKAKTYSYWQHWMCLGFVRQMLTPARSSSYTLPNATAAWRYAQKKHTTGVPPAGAPVYWRWVAPDGRDLGHIALSVGGGYVRSTDYPAYGRVGTVGLWKLTSLWGLGYRGWSEDYAGLIIPKLPGYTTTSSSIPAPYNYSEATAFVVNDEMLRVGTKSPSAWSFNAHVWSWLYWEGGTGGRSYCVQNYNAWRAEPADVFGWESVKAMRRMYAILDYRDGSGTSWASGRTATYPGPALLRKIGLKAD